MEKYSFRNDYSEGAHPQILETLLKTNLVQSDGYSDDIYCNETVNIIRDKINNQLADVHFVSGGTQANLIVISSALKPYESVIAASTAHIVVHETGAIESTGHKINLVETSDGKLKPADIMPVIDLHTDEHMVLPKLVFISNSTEIGSIYSKAELTELSVFCRKKGLLLYMDGARLGSALSSNYNDITLAELSSLLDVFYIGGTKNGAMLGEAIVINNDKLKMNFRFHLKQKGALLAKGRIFGVQFTELLKNDLFFELGKHANKMALKMAKAFEMKGYKFLTKPVSNQIFPILPNDVINRLSDKYEFYIWTKNNETHSTIRLVTSWATKEETVDKFISDI